MRPEALTNFAMSLVEKQAGLWSQLRQTARLYEDVVNSLFPAHVQSPRRVKILKNNFATNVRVLESRQMEWQSRAVQIAVLAGRPTRLVEECESFLMPSTWARPPDTLGGLLMYSVPLEPSPRPAAVMNDEMRGASPPPAPPKDYRPSWKTWPSSNASPPSFAWSTILSRLPGRRSPPNPRWRGGPC